jgi:hypothetical protein
MPFVVDASVVGSWLLPDEEHPEAVTVLDRLKEHEAFVPALLWFEIRNLFGRVPRSAGDALTKTSSHAWCHCAGSARPWAS